MQSNPIQQRIDIVCEKWEEAKKYTDARIVRIQCQPDETDMVNTFYTYMIGADSPIMDIAFHFDSQCTDLNTFSGLVLKELEEIIYIWNNSKKDSRIDYVPIQWKPDYSREKDKNVAAMFVENFNRLAKEMDLEKDLYAVAIFKAFANKEIILWFEHAIKATISTQVKFLIHDTVSAPSYKCLSKDWPLVVATIPLNLDMPKALEQVAAMGDPKDPATTYRQFFMKMMNAMGEHNEIDAQKWGHECIAIATQHLTKDPYWVMQIVVVYIALGNDKIRYKKKKETLDYADKAVETAVASQTYFENETASILLAQTLMFRATVFFVQGNYHSAFPDFSAAFEWYRKQGNLVLAIEASRMAGNTAYKEGQKIKGIKILAEGARLGRDIDAQTAQASTYPGLLELLLPTDYAHFISRDELDDIGSKIYGEDWKKLIYNWKKVPDKKMLKEQEQ